MANKMFQKVNSLPIDKVLTDHKVEVIGTGDNLFAISPFRKTSNKQSFTVSLSRNTFRDWKLDYGGGPVKFIEKLFSLDSDSAIEYLYQKYFEGKTGLPMVKLVKPVVTEERASLNLDELDKAYRIFLGLCSLTEEDKAYLKKERHLTDEEIAGFGFKSFPRRTIRQELQKELLENGINPIDIPGFFQYIDDEYISFPYYVGVIIPIRDTLGRINGIQIRKRNLKTTTDKRYVWLSSAFALNREGEKQKFKVNGRSPESPIGFIEGKFWHHSVTTVFITEGFFKALIIRQTFGSPSLTVQGITNWKKLPELIDNLKERYPRLNRIIFALDADFITNLNVGCQLCKMKNALKDKSLTLKTMLWDVDKGKGIDDLIENVGNIIPHIFLMDMDDFEEAYLEFEPIGKKMAEEYTPDEDFAAEYLRHLNKKGFTKERK